MRQALIDGDVLLYELGFAAEAGWQTGDLPPFDYVADLVDNRIANICALAEANDKPICFFTGKTNFRNDIAKRQKYKDRPSKKPFHYYNIKAYLKGKYEWRQQEGLEADDLMAIEQTRTENLLNGNPFYSGPSKETIICTRDKDLRAVPGWHFGWELGNQPQYGPTKVEEFGEIRLSHDRKSIKGEGLLFFYSQCLTGDRVDSIPGLEGMGPVKAFGILEGCLDIDDAEKRVLEAYRGVYGASAEEELLEQGRLLWMTRELDDQGLPVLWNFIEERKA